MSTMYIVYVISIQVSDSAQCECEDVSPYWLLVGISHFAIPCWYVTWALIEKFLFGISSRSQKVLGPKDEINSGFEFSWMSLSVLCKLMLGCLRTSTAFITLLTASAKGWSKASGPVVLQAWIQGENLWAQRAYHCKMTWSASWLLIWLSSDQMANQNWARILQHWLARIWGSASTIVSWFVRK